MARIQYGNLDLNLLMVLDRLLNRQSVSAAARDLGLSQPAASRALQRIRDQLRDPILVRVGRGMVLTERARGLIGPVSAALAAAEQVFAPPPDFDPQTATGTLTLGLGAESQEAFVQPLVQRLSVAAPHTDLRIRALHSASVEEAQRGQLDIALAPDLSVLPNIAGAVDLSELVARTLYTRRFVVAGSPARWPVAPDLETYLQARHVIVSFEGGGRGFVDALLAEEGLQRRVAVSVTSFPAVARLIAETDMLAVIPEEISHAFGLTAHPPPLALPTLPMLLLWHPRRTTETRHRFFRQLVRDVVLAQLRQMLPHTAETRKNR